MSNCSHQLLEVGVSFPPTLVEDQSFRFIGQKKDFREVINAYFFWNRSISDLQFIYLIWAQTVVCLEVGQREFVPWKEVYWQKLYLRFWEWGVQYLHSKSWKKFPGICNSSRFTLLVVESIVKLLLQNYHLGEFSPFWITW